jgi:hypothetical protein
LQQIVLIGPVAAGKSTIAALLSERTGIRNVPLDLIRWYYYYRIGYDRAEERRREAAEGPAGRYAYWKPFEVYAVEQALSDYPDAIIDFGAGHSVHDDAERFARVASALASASHVILLLPSPDRAVSLRILLERLAPPAERATFVAARQAALLASPCNARLATATIYTAGQTAEETCAQVLALLE